MTDRPIIFSAPMVRALLEGRKTQTRRVLREQRTTAHPVRVLRHPIGEKSGHAFEWRSTMGAYLADVAVPYTVGDRLWVREAHSLHGAHGQHRDDGMRWGPWAGLPTATSPDGAKIAYYRDGFDRCDGGPWRPSIHMPRWASRLTLTVTDVRVQRVRDISEDDAKAEGIGSFEFAFASDRRQHRPDVRFSDAFADLWNSIHGPDAWDANPWVAAITFTVREGNIDKVPACS